MELWIGAISLGFLYAFMAMGVFITFRIHDFADITVDGSFTAGAAVAAVILVSGGHPLLALIGAFFIGSLAGIATAVIHTRLGVNSLLAGILTMTGLYSINLHIMKRSNIPLLNQTTLFTNIAAYNPGLPGEIWNAIALLVIMIVFWQLVSIFFRTDLGIAMRATGNNAIMASATGRNVELIKIFGVALANGLVAVSGAMVAQFQGFADIGMGIGTVVVGLASVILGESILKSRSIYIKVLSVIIGSVIFRLMIAVALYLGMNPIDLKLLTALFVLLTLILSKVYSDRNNGKSRKWKIGELLSGKKLRIATLSALVLMIIIVAGFLLFRPHEDKKEIKIGLAQVADNGLLDVTRDAFIAEMHKIGYTPDKNCTIILENANGDLPVLNSIIDKFILDDVDLVLAISTPVTQAAVNKIKDRPVVFATVANPFIVGAGKSETDHLPNITGVYGGVPMDRTLKLAEAVLGDKLRIGCIWDPSQANAVFNVEQLKVAVAANPKHTFMGTTVAGSSEVYQGAQSLVNRGIDVFILPPDNIIYSAFESVVKAAGTRRIPIFMSDVERLPDGALVTLGYDYTSSGIQAAHLVDRILHGENPAKIPFERYRKITIGVNLKVAKENGITLPAEVMQQATLIIDEQGNPENLTDKTESAPGKRMAMFQFSDHTMMDECARGIMDQFADNGILKQKGITIDRKNAQSEFSLGQSIVQDIVRRDYDYILTMSTPALQITAQINKKIPHVFGAVTDPYRMGVATDSTHHIANLTGVATFQPVEYTLKTMRELLPDAKRLGLVWTPSEACSEACTYKARDAAEKYGFELIEATVTSTTEVIDALNSVLGRGIDLFLTTGDNTVLMTFESIAEILRKAKIPYFTNTPADIKRGAFIAIGADYYDVGRATARQMTRVINGENPADIPIMDCVPIQIGVNLPLARELGITLPQDFIKRAKVLKR